MERAQVFCKRFRDELGYRYSEAFPIYRQGHGSRAMYYMIHASDHPDACALMSRAYGLVRPEVNAVDVPLPLAELPLDSVTAPPVDRAVRSAV